MNIFKQFVIIAIFTVFLLAFPVEAHAYLDPGAGSYVLQIVLAGIVGASFMVKVYWKKIKLFLLQIFSGNKKLKNSDEHEA